MSAAKTRQPRRFKEERAAIWSTVSWIEGGARRCMGCVVVRIDEFDTDRPSRTVVIRLNGSVDGKKADSARLQRAFRRIQALGIRFNTRLEGIRECDGISGTVFAHTTAAVGVAA